jgi:hypothetical protein
MELQSRSSTRFFRSYERAQNIMNRAFGKDMTIRINAIDEAIIVILCPHKTKSGQRVVRKGLISTYSGYGIREKRDFASRFTPYSEVYTDNCSPSPRPNWQQMRAVRIRSENPWLSKLG